MREENIHINRHSSGSYPEPGITPNAAWEKMKQLLDEDNNPPSPPINKFNPGLQSYKIFLAILLIIAGLIYILNNIPAQSVNTPEKTNFANTPTSSDTNGKHNPPSATASATGNLFKKKSAKTTDPQQQQDNDKIPGTQPVAKKLFQHNDNKVANKIDSTLEANTSAATTVGLIQHQKTIAKKIIKDNIPATIPPINNSKKSSSKNNLLLPVPVKIKSAHGTKLYLPYAYKSKGHRTKKPVITGNMNTGQQRLQTQEDIISTNFKKHEISAALVSNCCTMNDSNTQVDVGKITSIFSLTGTGGWIAAFRDSLQKNNIKTLTNLNAPQKKKTTPTLNNKIHSFHFGLQWNVPLPVTRTDNYFTAANGKSQPYDLLIPGIWASKTFGKKQLHSFRLHINVASQFLAGNKLISNTTGIVSATDTTQVLRSTQIAKTSGYSLGIFYNYNFSTRWTAGIGLYYTQNKKALLNKQTTKLASGELLDNSIYSADNLSADWQYINNHLLLGKLELGYKFKKIVTGTTLSLPLNNLSIKQGYSIHPLNAELFVRWQIE